MAQTDGSLQTEASWAEIVSEFRENGNMVVEFKRTGLIPTKRILGLRDDSEPLDGVRVLSHTETVRSRRFYAVLEHQQHLDALRERMREVASRYADKFMLEDASAIRAFLGRLPTRFEAGRF